MLSIIGSTRLSNPQGIAAGPDGALWFAESPQGTVGRLTTASAVLLYPGADGPFDVTTGPDGALWFTEYSNHLGHNAVIFLMRGCFDQLLPVPAAYLTGSSGVILLPGSPVQSTVYGVNTTFEQGVTQVRFPGGSGVTVDSIASRAQRICKLRIPPLRPHPYAWIYIYEQAGAQAAVRPNASLEAF